MSTLFWGLVYARRKQSESGPGSEINFEGKLASSPQEISQEWTKHFATDDARCDNEHTHCISKQVQIINESLIFPELFPLLMLMRFRLLHVLARKEKPQAKTVLLTNRLNLGMQL